MVDLQNNERVTRAASRAIGPSLPARECLTFRLGTEEYGIDILTVQEIRAYEIPTRIAHAAAVIKGVLNLRGVIVPVVDLRLHLGLEEVVYDALTVTIVLNIAGRVVGAVVDSVSDVVELNGEQIRPAPEFNDAVRARFITGIGTIDQGTLQRTLILIDIEEVLSGAEIGLLEQSLH